MNSEEEEEVCGVEEEVWENPRGRRLLSSSLRTIGIRGLALGVPAKEREREREREREGGGGGGGGYICKHTLMICMGYCKLVTSTH